MTRKPPLGIKPRRLVEQDRAKDILWAMIRYISDGVVIPKEWIDELGELLSRNDLVRRKIYINRGREESVEELC